MKRISTTIMGMYMQAILDGVKKTELKVATPFWKKRLQPLLGDYKKGELLINFLCGQESYRYWVTKVERYKTEAPGVEITLRLYSTDYYVIHLGERAL